MLALGLASSTLLELRVLPFYVPWGLPVSKGSPAPTFLEKPPFSLAPVLGLAQAVGFSGRFVVQGEL